MCNVIIREPRDEDYPYLIKHLRAGDRVYLPKTDFKEAAEKSIYLRVAEWNGNPVIIYGVQASQYEGVGIPWLMSTHSIRYIAKAVLKQAPAEVRKMHTYFNSLENGISIDNKLHIKWLKRLGFDIGPDHGTGFLAIGRYEEIK